MHSFINFNRARVKIYKPRRLPYRAEFKHFNTLHSCFKSHSVSAYFFYKACIYLYESLIICRRAIALVMQDARHTVYMYIFGNNFIILDDLISTGLNFCKYPPLSIYNWRIQLSRWAQLLNTTRDSFQNN